MRPTYLTLTSDDRGHDRDGATGDESQSTCGSSLHGARSNHEPSGDGSNDPVPRPNAIHSPRTLGRIGNTGGRRR